MLLQKHLTLTVVPTLRGGPQILCLFPPPRGVPFTSRDHPNPTPTIWHIGAHLMLDE